MEEAIKVRERGAKMFKKFFKKIKVAKKVLAAVDKVEDLIIDEAAMETAFEGNRFYDLMRVAQRRNDPTYLADKVARRKGEAHGRNDALFMRLSNKDNWFIHRD